jgi:HPt (histidine-containing phosphotransfer) domain-containing protein
VNNRRSIAHADVVSRLCLALLMTALSVTVLVTPIVARASGAGPSVMGATRVPEGDSSGVGRAVVVSLAILFVGVSLGQWGLQRARRGRNGLSPDSQEVAPVLDASWPCGEVVAKSFLKHAPAQVSALGHAIEVGDAALVATTAHKLKGSCLAIGAQGMAKLCGLLEARGGDAAAHYAQLCRDLMQAERELAEQLVRATDGVS